MYNVEFEVEGDHLIMRITYYEIAPLALTLMFSKERNMMRAA